MDLENPVVWVVIGLVALTITIVAIAPHFSPEARLERRRRKNNARVVTKAQRPTVKLSARTKNPKEHGR